MEIIQQLVGLGLSTGEAAAYVACLELGEGPIVPIARKLSVPRTSLSYTLERLAERGMVEILHRGSRKSYAPCSPREVLGLLRAQAEEARSRADSFEGSLPELARLYHATPFQPKVRIFQGTDGLQDIYREMITSRPKEICYVGSTAQIAEAVGDRFLTQWIRQRAEAGIPSRAIRVRSGELEVPEYIARKQLLRKVRYAPQELQSPAVIFIYRDCVAVVTTAKESFGVVTTSQDYAESMRGWFEELWKVSEEK